MKQKIIRRLPTLIKDSVMAIDRGNQITIITDEPMIDTKGNPSLIIVGVHKDVEMDGEIKTLQKVYTRLIICVMLFLIEEKISLLQTKTEPTKY